MKKISLKKALELYGAVDIEIHNGFKYRYGFFNKDNQLYYFNVSIDNEFRGLGMLIRTAEHRKDYTGGRNTYPLESFLSKYGYKLSVPSKRCDYNRL